MTAEASHVFGLETLHKRVVRLISRIIGRRRFTAVMGVAIVLVTALHSIEGWVWAAPCWLLRALSDLPSSVLFSFGAMTTYGSGGFDLPPHWQLMGALEALNAIILFGLTTAFLFSMIQEVWLTECAERRRH